MGNFLDAFFLVEFHDVRVRLLVVVLLIHLVVAGAQGSNLRQVGDADDLSVLFTHLLHDASHLLGDTARHARVDFVEDNRWEFHLTGYERFQREHHAGNFTARCHLLHGLQCRVLVGTEKEFHSIYTRWTEFVRVLLHIHSELHIRHAQWHEAFHHLLFHLLGGFLPLLREFLG